MLETPFDKQFAHFFEEDDLSKNAYYFSTLPKVETQCHLKFKDDLVISGLPFFFSAFEFLGAKIDEKEKFLEFEGKVVKKSDAFQIDFTLPFNIALTGERIALNLLQRCCAITTFSKQFVEKAEELNIKILDTRKTTPGLRAFEKYATRMAGAFNHRMAQADVWMVKDNHKKIFGGLEQAVNFFRDQQTFYNPLVVEIHDLDELKQAQILGVKHMMLDNFGPDEIREAISIKQSGSTYEVSGGIRLENIENYLIEGVDAISIGALTYAAPAKDISMKMSRLD